MTAPTVLAYVCLGLAAWLLAGAALAFVIGRAVAIADRHPDPGPHLPT